MSLCRSFFSSFKFSLILISQELLNHHYYYYYYYYYYHYYYYYCYYYYYYYIYIFFFELAQPKTAVEDSLAELPLTASERGS